MANLLDLFRSDLGKIQSRLRTVREGLERAKQRREELMILPPPPDEVADKIIAVLELRATSFAQEFDQLTDHLRRDPLVTAESPGVMNSNILFRGDIPRSRQIEGLLFECFGDQLRNAIKRRCAAVKCKTGPSVRDREAELQQLKVQCADLEREERDMVKELDAVRQATIV